MKRKRIGAGQRGSSDPFLTAKELLKASASNKESEGGGFYADGSEGSKVLSADKSAAVTSTIRDRANAAAVSMNSPTKGGKAKSKKQQMLAEAAKNTRNIFQYFAKKETVETIQTEPQEQESTSTASAETASVSQSAETNQCLDTEGAETQDVILVERKCEVVTIDDGDDKNEEEQTHETTTLDLKPENDEPSEDGRSGPDHHIFIFILIQLFL